MRSRRATTSITSTMFLTTRTARRLGLGVTALVLATTSCSLVGSGDDDTAADGGGDGTSSEGGTVTLLTHSDFSLPKKVIRAFEQESGYTLQIETSDGVAVLTNSLVENAGRPAGDVAFGVDNTYGSRALDGDAFAPFEGTLPDGVADYALPGDDDDRLVPVDNGGVCINVDDAWFAERDQTPPSTLDDLTDPAYRDLLVVPSPAYSSPGLAFLLTTVAAYGDDWPDYWADLVDNGVSVAKGWSEAYYDGFTGGGEGGDRPIVLSYDSSPAFTVSDGESTTSALLDTCYQQVEYAGVLEGTDNPEGAQALVEFMLGSQVQEALPESMYVFPVVPGTTLPTEWASFAPRPADPYEVDPQDVEDNRQDWLTEWADVTS